MFRVLALDKIDGYLKSTLVMNRKYMIPIFIVVIIGISVFFLNKKNTFSSDTYIKKHNNLKVYKGYNILDSLFIYDVKQANLQVEQLYSGINNIKDSLQLAYVYCYKIRSDRQKNQFDSIELFLNRALNYSKNGHDKKLDAKLNYEFGVYYSNEENYPLSLEYLLKAKDFFEKEGGNEYANVCNVIGINYLQLENTEKSRFYHQQAYNIYQKNNDLRGVAMHYINISGVLVQEKRYSEAVEKLNMSLENFKEMKDTVSIIKVLGALSDRALQSGNRTASIEYLDQANSLAKTIGNTLFQGHILFHYGNIYQNNNEYDKAIQFYKRGFQMIGDSKYDIEILKTMSNIYSTINRDKDAYDYLNKYYLMKDSIIGKDVKNKIETLHYHNKLKMEQHNKDVEEQKSKQQLYVYLIIMVSVISVSVFIWFLYRNKAKSLLISDLENKRLEERYRVEKEFKLLKAEQYENDIKIRNEFENLKNKQHEIEIDSKNKEMTSINLQLLVKNNLLKEVEEILKNKNQNLEKTFRELENSIRRNRSQDKDWDQFRKVFDLIHPDFFNSLSSSYPELTKTELRICAYIKINMANHEIASLLNITTQSLIVSRYRIRKKMKLNRSEDLDKHISLFS